MCAEVKVPAFMKGRQRVSMAEVIDTRKIAHVRIHVERVIGSVRQKYTILGGAVPIDFVLNVDDDNYTMLDKIAAVCCSLTNLNPTIVVFD